MMNYLKFGFGLLLCNLAIISTAALAVDETEIAMSEGSVTLSDAGGTSQKKLDSKDKLPKNGILETGADGRAIVHVGKIGYVVMEKNSKIEINTANDHAGFFRHITGVVYYAVNSIKNSDRTLDVRLKTATMGIRGTRFLVTDLPERTEVGMRKGALTVSSQNEEFEIHKRNEKNGFEAAKLEPQLAITAEKNQFEKYKANAQNEYIEFKREFTLGVNHMVTFDGRRVNDTPLSGSSKKDMETLEKYAEKWLNQVQD